jgi:hypothetical protein
MDLLKDSLEARIWKHLFLSEIIWSMRLVITYNIFQWLSFSPKEEMKEVSVLFTENSSVGEEK